MSGHSENAEDVTEDEEIDLKLRVQNFYKNNDQGNTYSGSSSSQQNSIIVDEYLHQRNSSEQITVEKNETEVDLVEKIRHEKKEIKKQKNFIKLPTEPEVPGIRCIQENVGDDINKKEEIRILCECEPNVSGAAVPTVASFINTPHDHYDDIVYNVTPTVPNTNIGIIKTKNQNVSEKTTSTKHDEPNSKTDNEKTKCIDTLGNKDIQDNKNVKNQSIGTPDQKVNKDKKIQVKKPSLIPKLTKTNGLRSRDGNGAKDHGPKDYNTPYNEKMRNSKMQLPKSFGKSMIHKELESDKVTSNTISSKMVDLQEGLKVTTSLLRQRIEKDKSDHVLTENNCEIDPIEEAGLKTNANSKQTLDDLYKNISRLKDAVTSLSKSSTFSGQRKYIEKLFLNISQIKSIANKLCERECNSPTTESSSRYSLELTEDMSDKNCDEVVLLGNGKLKTTPVNSKDNKIRIKLLKYEGKIKNIEKSLRERSEEVQTELSLGTKLTSESLSSITCHKSKIKNTDSMDGVFIPTYEPPVNIEDEDETYGLDITITFPEFENLKSTEAESNLPVCVSDISAEALKKLKRCPKDFKLLMNFVEGKVSFQSGAGPTNNFSLSPDSKFIASVDYKKSDVINIKPSTECLYSSQLIPVDNPTKPKASIKSLKSTDSELLFNVVNLPVLYRNPNADDSFSPKSCITFRNEKLLSVAILARQFFKSMPQIPSLTNIFEDELMGNSKTDSRKAEEKSSVSKEKD